MTGSQYYSLTNLDFAWTLLIDKSIERFAPVCVAKNDRSGGGSFMVWTCIGTQEKTGLYIIQNGTLTAAGYVNEILDVYVCQYAGAIGPDFILMDDNASPRSALAANQYPQTATIERMDWPPRSPDLNPIEHAADCNICQGYRANHWSRAATGTNG